MGVRSCQEFCRAHSRYGASRQGRQRRAALRPDGGSARRGLRRNAGPAGLAGRRSGPIFAGNAETVSPARCPDARLVGACGVRARGRRRREGTAAGPDHGRRRRGGRMPLLWRRGEGDAALVLRSRLHCHARRDGGRGRIAPQPAIRASGPARTADDRHRHPSGAGAPQAALSPLRRHRRRTASRQIRSGPFEPIPAAYGAPAPPSPYRAGNADRRADYHQV